MRGAAAWLCLAGATALAIALLPLKWAAALVAGGIIVLAILVYPQVGVLLMSLSVPFGSLWQVGVGVASFGLTEVLLFLVLLSWFMRVTAGRGARVSARGLAAPLLAFLGILSVSLIAAQSLQHGAVELFKWIEVLAVFLLVSGEIDQQWARVVVAVLLVTGALAAAHGIMQFLSGAGPESFLLFGRFTRAYGMFEQPNPYAGYLGLSVPLAVGLLGAFTVARRDRPNWRWLAPALLTGALMMGAIGMSWSRGAWLGVVVSVAAVSLALLLRSARAWLWGSLAVGALALGLLAVGPADILGFVSDRFGDFVPYLSTEDLHSVEITDENFAVVERLAHWQAALDMWAEHPWLGVGPGNYEVAYAAFSLPAWPLPLGHAHNYYLNTAAETGILGLFAFLILCGATLARAWVAARRTSGFALGVALGVLGAIVHLCVHSLFDNLFVHGIYLHLSVLLGLLVVCEKESA